jgi:glycine/D-amino acid oxidase-like deaminating enzyme/nitrite reductase/ring-hydroxylating ferredoxin subunit
VDDAEEVDEDVSADVCIIGAGIAGLTTAYRLAVEGKSVVVVEDGEIASGETSRTTAHLVNALDDRFYHLEQLHGEKGARLAAQSHSVAIDLIESIVSTERIDCEFERVDGYLFVPPGESIETLEKELEATHRVGLQATRLIDRAPIPSFDTGPCLHFPNQAQFHPLKYLAALVQCIEDRGGRIFTNTHAESIDDGEPARVATTGGPAITASAIVVATNTPVSSRFVIHTKQAAYRTYVIGLPVSKGVVPKALYWDTPDPYHYVRLQDAGDHGVLIVGGEDHKTGQAHDAEARYAHLETWTRDRFPVTGDAMYRWSGQVMEPVDSLAFIGRNPGDKHVYVVTGDSGNGMTHGTIAGILLPDLILGRENAWETLYDPSRKSLRAAGEFAKENLNVAAQYGDLVTGGDVRRIDEIPTGSGAVIRDGMRKLAVFRDAQGKTHAFSAVCPHLGCIIDWNDGEKSWDCPCHGSRFDPQGRVINGPANTDLEPVDGIA